MILDESAEKMRFGISLVLLSLTLWIYSDPALLSTVPPASIHEIFEMIVAIAVLLHSFIAIPWRSRTWSE